MSILAAIIMPVTLQAKQASKKTQCLSNLHQIGAATMLYVGDYDDRLPAAIDAWARYLVDVFPYDPTIPGANVVLRPYAGAKQVFACPADRGARRTGIPAYVENFYDLVGSSYTFPKLPRGLPLASIADSSKTVYSSDCAPAWHAVDDKNLFQSRRSWLFLDGHVKFGPDPGPDSHITDEP
ncbi:MAG: hypothetical protein ABL949_04515 [Fimbriimonadaceae bacterium]